MTEEKLYLEVLSQTLNQTLGGKAYAHKQMLYLKQISEATKDQRLKKHDLAYRTQVEIMLRQKVKINFQNDEMREEMKIYSTGYQRSINQ